MDREDRGDGIGMLLFVLAWVAVALVIEWHGLSTAKRWCEIGAGVFVTLLYVYTHTRTKEES